MQSLLGLPAAASAHAADIDHLMNLLHWMILILFVGWGFYFFYVLLRFRSSRSPQASYTGARTHASSYVEGGVALAEAILLIGFSIPLWSQRINAFPDQQEAVNVRIVAEQFAWNVHYPGADGIFGGSDVNRIDLQTNPLGLDRSDPSGSDDIVTLNQLHLPVNRPAIIHVFSKDVIHSFTLTEMRIKQDAVPGLSIPLWFTPTVTTEEMRQWRGDPNFNYEIACAQLCGLGHYRMRGFMTIHEEEDFDAWLAEQAAAQAQGQADDPFWQ